MADQYGMKVILNKEIDTQKMKERITNKRIKKKIQKKTL